MELTSFVLGVCAVIILLMVAGTSVNYMVTKELKKEIDNINQGVDYNFNNLYQDLEALTQEISITNNDLIAHTDSRVDKLSNALNDIVKEHEVTLNYNGEMANTNATNIKNLVKEIARVEKGYKEKINY